MNAIEREKKFTKKNHAHLPEHGYHGTPFQEKYESLNRNFNARDNLVSREKKKNLLKKPCSPAYRGTPFQEKYESLNRNFNARDNLVSNGCHRDKKKTKKKTMLTCLSMVFIKLHSK